jgi:hypothetical protein
MPAVLVSMGGILILPLQLVGCRLISCNDCEPQYQSYWFVNETDYPVLVTASWGGADSIPPSGWIFPSDTSKVKVSLTVPSLEGGFPWDGLSYFSFQFQTGSPRCLVYRDTVKDSLNDPRSRLAYSYEVVPKYSITKAQFDSAGVCP